jgi:four helix bundle protein
MGSYKDLEIYKLSYRLALEVHKLTMQLPQYELYEEGGQARRSSKSISALIAEGYGRSKYKAEYIKFLIYALGSGDETTVHLNFIKDTHEDKTAQALSLLGEYDELGKRINKFITYVEENWRT